MSDVRITMTSHGRGTVEVDGQKIEATAVRFRADPNKVNRVFVELQPDTVFIEGDAVVSYPTMREWLDMKYTVWRADHPGFDFMACAEHIRGFLKWLKENGT